MGGPKKIENFMQKAGQKFEKKSKKWDHKNGDSAAEVPKKSTWNIIKNDQQRGKTHLFL